MIGWAATFGAGGLYNLLDTPDAFFAALTAAGADFGGTDGETVGGAGESLRIICSMIQAGRFDLATLGAALGAVVALVSGVSEICGV